MDEKAEFGNTVLVDMDNVLADFDGAIISRLSADIGHVARKSFFLHHDLPEHEEHIFYIAKHPEFFHSLPLMEGALEGWQRLLELGYHPRICSAPLEINEQSVLGKQAWIEEHLVPRFGKHVLDSAIIDLQKYKYEGFALIDDRPDINTGEGRATWTHVVFDWPYNANLSGSLRLHGWNDPNLGPILDEARRLAMLRRAD